MSLVFLVLVLFCDFRIRATYVLFFDFSGVFRFRYAHFPPSTGTAFGMYP